MDNTSPSKSNTLVKVIACGAVGFAVWSLLPPEWRENINRGIYQSSEEMAAAKRRKDEQQRLELIKQSTIEYFQKHKFTLDLPQLSEALLLPPSGVKTEPLALDNQSTPLLSDAKTNIDLIWLKRIIHPSLVLILGKRGSGKSALAYYLIEIHRYGLKPYVVGIPQSKQHLLPEWVGVASSLEEVPFGAIVIVDEAYLLYHARGSTTQESKEMAKIINLSRQKGQTIIFVTQESRSIDKNIASSVNVII
jgi:hypothetical protein